MRRGPSGRVNAGPGPSGPGPLRHADGCRRRPTRSRGAWPGRDVRRCQPAQEPSVGAGAPSVLKLWPQPHSLEALGLETLNPPPIMFST